MIQTNKIQAIGGSLFIRVNKDIIEVLKLQKGDMVLSNIIKKVDIIEVEPVEVLYRCTLDNYEWTSIQDDPNNYCPFCGSEDLNNFIEVESTK
jgi:DNA-directed RNA polymerase subunit RPC12/RpoP